MGLEAGETLGEGDATGVVAGAGMTGVEGGCVAATGVGVGKTEGEAAGACALAMATRMKRQNETQAHISEAILWNC